MDLSAQMRKRRRIRRYSMNSMNGNPMRISGSAMMAENGENQERGKQQKVGQREGMQQLCLR